MREAHKRVSLIIWPTLMENFRKWFLATLMYVDVDETCHATKTTENLEMSGIFSRRSKFILAMATLQQHPSIWLEENHEILSELVTSPRFKLETYKTQVRSIITSYLAQFMQCTMYLLHTYMFATHDSECSTEGGGERVMWRTWYKKLHILSSKHT